MKSKLIIFLLLFYFKGCSQKKEDIDNTIYVFTRSTELKVAYIAKDFNIKDTLSTHVGIGIKKNGKYEIYNVSNDQTYNKSALICENLDSFIKVNGVKYFSVWKIDISKTEFKRFCKILKKYLNQTIVFDYDFSINDDNKLYCSEFVYDVLKQTNNVKFSFNPIIKELSQFYKLVLNRDYLEFIPVDFFTQMNLFEKIDEHYYPK